jgi:acetylornithine deacetylase/succinyl-diaminopimelate desuccinylase-like protein
VTIATLRQRCLDLLADWTAIPSVAGDAVNLGRMATALQTHLRDRLGAEIIVHGHPGDAPLVHARIDRGRSKTILLYNMYDVMAADADGWSVAPFTGGVTELAGLGACYVGRGAENNKGPLAGMLVALAALLDAGDLDANVELVIEGQEETGSAALRAYLQAADCPVRACGAALFPSFCEYGGGAPRVYLGSKGIAHGHVGVASGRWGGPYRAIHSSNAPWIANPAWRLVQALAALGGALDHMPLPADARPILETLAANFDPQAELIFRHADRFSIPGDAVALLEHVLTSNSLNLATLRTAPQDGRAVIPSQASAQFDLRLAPGADPHTLLAQMSRDIAAYDAEVLVDDAYPGHRFRADQPAVAALLATYHEAGTQPQVWPWTIGAMPAYAFARVAPCFLIGGLGRGGNAHGVDEFMTLDGLSRFLSFLLAWLPATAAAIVPQPT